MIGATLTMALAALQAETAHRLGLRGDEAGRRRHGGWAVIVCAAAFYNAATRWAFG